MEGNNLSIDDATKCETKNEKNTRSGSRPASYYENNVLLKNSNSISNNNMSDESTFVTIPSQTQCLNTTVPQNIAAQNIAGKHTPTRNSLRHSRMIVLHRSGQVPKKYLPPILRYRRIAKLILAVVSSLGIVLCFISLWLLLWSPNIRTRDNPYWSAIPAFVSGMVGLTLLCCCPKDYPGRIISYWFQSIKVLSLSTSLIAAVASIVVCSFAIVHLLTLASMTCAPPDKLNSTCLCKSNSSETSRLIDSYHYVDLSCDEVDNVFKNLIMLSCAVNVVICLCECVYLYLHWTSRHTYKYFKVPMDENRLVLQKNHSR